MPLLVITRDARGETGYLRRVRVKVDGVVVAKVRFRGEKTVPLTPGEHEVVAAMDWFSSPPLRVVAGEDDTVTVRVSYSYATAVQGFANPAAGLTAELVE